MILPVQAQKYEELGKQKTKLVLNKKEREIAT